MSSRLQRALLAVTLASGACAPKTAPHELAPVALAVLTSPPGVPEARLTVDTKSATASGSTFMAPHGWTMRAEAERVALESPDPDLRLMLEDEAVDASAEVAVAAAWRALDPTFARPLKSAERRPARHGWDEQTTLVYETLPSERTVVRAYAFRKGVAWTVVLLRSSEASLEKRLAQVKLVTDSLRPRGFATESFEGRAPHPLDAPRLAEVASFIEKARAELGIPGVAISLFTTDHVLVEDGFGVRQLGATAKVDPDTLFLIASNTKALTTLLLARLVDQGLFGWDSKVKDVYPSFQLGDAETEARMSMRHLVCACTGLPRQDLEWLFGFKEGTASSTMTLLGTMRPTSAFGEVYQYSNVLASAAGFIAGAALYPGRELGVAYDDAMRSRVFGPLGMASTTFDFEKALAANHASPHDEDIDGQPAVAVIDVDRAIVPLRPSGGAWSSLHDLRRYVQMELAKGRLVDGTRFVSERALLERRAPEVRIGEDETYGMGLRVDGEYGVPYVHHGGGLVGYKSDVFWLPDEGVGGVLLTNATSGGLLLHPFVRKVFEELFDGHREADDDVMAAATERKTALAKERARRSFPAKAAVISKLAPRYTNPVLGELTVRTDARGTMIDTGRWRSLVASRVNDDGTLSLLTVEPGADGFELVVDPREPVPRLVIRDAQHDYAFIAKP